MSRSSEPGRRSPRALRGFSLVELLVSLLIFTVVIMVPMYLLFTMRNHAEKQQYTIVPRQAARRAVDYLSFYVGGASDLNADAGNPNAVITYFNSDASNAASVQQASYDNLTAAQAGLGYGDEGTDIISLAVPAGPVITKVPIVLFPPELANQPVEFTYRGGCGVLNDDAANMARFQLVTGASGIPPRSGLLTAVDFNGNWSYFRISSYGVSDCDLLKVKNITATASPGRPTTGPDFGPIDVPAGHATMGNPSFLVVGLQFVSFRVRNGNLEQKNGIFSPVSLPDVPQIGNADTTAGGNTNFFTIVENIEDFQVAYLYGNLPMFAGGGVWNSASQTLATGVPPQAGVTASPGDQDITRVLGLRISVLGRSAPMSLGVRQITLKKGLEGVAGESRRFRPGIENHPGADPDAFDDRERYRVTTTLLLRNRTLGS
jgi:prepilin-type N-terminal cleavage/methylation domain-containing protein